MTNSGVKLILITKFSFPLRLFNLRKNSKFKILNSLLRQILLQLLNCHTQLSFIAQW